MITNMRRKVSLNLGNVYHRTVSDAGSLSDSDLVDITAHDSSVPDAFEKHKLDEKTWKEALKISFYTHLLALPIKTSPITEAEGATNDCAATLGLTPSTLTNRVEGTSCSVYFVISILLPALSRTVLSRNLVRDVKKRSNNKSNEEQRRTLPISSLWIVRSKLERLEMSFLTIKENIPCYKPLGLTEITRSSCL
jgi:hypothetical protein